MAEHVKHGDFVRISPNHISINNTEAVAQIYSHKSGFLKSDFYDAFMQVKPNVFNTQDVDVHRRKRKYQNPAFSARALAEYEPHMNEELLKWKNKLLHMLCHDKVNKIDFAVWSNFLAFDVIGSFCFGKPFGFIEAGRDPYNLIHTINTRGEVFNALATIPSWIRPVMKYNFFDSFWSEGLSAAADLAIFGRKAYAERLAAKSPGKDFLSYMISATDPTTGQKLDTSEVLAESMAYIVAGSDTTSATITHFIDIVSRDDTLQERIHAEIEKTFPGQLDHNWIPPNSVVSEMPLLNGVLREVMRIRSTAAIGLERITPAGGRVIAGEYIPAGTRVSVPTCGVMVDERVFKDPGKIIPERWEGDSVKELLEYFLPFSVGPRSCIGRNFAWMEILKALVVIFKIFRLERTRKEPTVIREGFFYKAQECEVVATIR